jgi:Zn-dependent alcohol dehydrogenase
MFAPKGVVMIVRAAALLSAPGKYQTIEVEPEGPRQNEVLVRVAAPGLCHSDDHIATGDPPVGKYAVVGGHEGAGVVVEVGRNTTGVKAGDQIVFSFIPVCGRCRWCATGHQNLCTRDLSQQWTRRKGIRVNAIAPGCFDSEMTAATDQDKLSAFIDQTASIKRFCWGRRRCRLSPGNSRDFGADQLGQRRRRGRRAFAGLA